MTRSLARRAVPILASVLALGLAACTSAPREFGPVAALDRDAGYHADNHIDFDDDTLMILTLSGGGVRAAALAQGVLEALDAVPHDGGTLLDEVDLISSTSGGTVAAANYVLHGREGFAAFRENLIYRNLMTGLIAETVLNPPLPWSLAVRNDRIEPSVRMFERQVVGEATYGDIPAEAPFWIANATDIESGLTFPFTQYQFDILCADLGAYPVSRAVAASTAFPVAVSSVVIRNNAPCPAQKAPSGKRDGNLLYIDRVLGNFPNLRRGHDAAAVERALVATDMMSDCAGEAPCRRPDYVHLYDGGIADNLGLGEPFWLLTGARAPWNKGLKGYVTARDADGVPVLRTVAIAAVNAAASSPSRIGRSPRAPTMLTAMRSVLGTMIDRRSIGLTAQLDALSAVLTSRRARKDPVTGKREPLAVSVASLSFDQIVDPVCRVRASAIGTNWGIARHEADAVLNLGAALAFASSPFRKVAGVVADDEVWDEAARCHVETACTCLADPRSCRTARISMPARCEARIPDPIGATE